MKKSEFYLLPSATRYHGVIEQLQLQWPAIEMRYRPEFLPAKKPREIRQPQAHAKFVMKKSHGKHNDNATQTRWRKRIPSSPRETVRQSTRRWTTTMKAADSATTSRIRVPSTSCVADPAPRTVELSSGRNREITRNQEWKRIGEQKTNNPLLISPHSGRNSGHNDMDKSAMDWLSWGKSSTGDPRLPEITHTHSHTLNQADVQSCV